MNEPGSDSPGRRVQVQPDLRQTLLTLCDLCDLLFKFIPLPLPAQTPPGMGFMAGNPGSFPVKGGGGVFEFLAAAPLAVLLDQGEPWRVGPGLEIQLFALPIRTTQTPDVLLPKDRSGVRIPSNFNEIVTKGR